MWHLHVRMLPYHSYLCPERSLRNLCPKHRLYVILSKLFTSKALHIYQLIVVSYIQSTSTLVYHICLYTEHRLCINLSQLLIYSEHHLYTSLSQLLMSKALLYISLSQLFIYAEHRLCYSFKASSLPLMSKASPLLLICPDPRLCCLYPESHICISLMVAAFV